MVDLARLCLASYPVPLKKGRYRLSTYARIITSLSSNNVSQMMKGVVILRLV